jgi:hypothetical protein
MKLLKGQISGFLFMMIKFFLMIAFCVGVFLLVTSLVNSPQGGIGGLYT